MTAPHATSLLILAAGTVLAPAGSAQQRPLIVRGVVTTEGRSPLSQALVYVDSGRVRARTDSTGVFVLAEVDPGEHFLHLRSTGYAPRSFRLVLPEHRGPALEAYVGEIVLRPGPPPTLTLAGQITDGVSGEPVSGVEVHVNEQLLAFSDEQGLFAVRRAAASWGPNVVMVRRIGYDGATADVWVETPDARVQLSLEIHPFAVRLPEVAVEADRAVYAWGDFAGFLERRKGAYGHFFTAAEIAERQPPDLAALFVDVPGIVVRGEAGGRRVVRFLRGPGDCHPVFFMDGVEMIGQLDLVDMLHPMDLEGIEIYSGNATIPLQFAADGNECGAIIIWRKRPN